MINCRQCKFWDEDWELAIRDAASTSAMHECRVSPPTMVYQVFGQVGLWPMTAARHGCGAGKPIPATKASVSP